MLISRLRFLWRSSAVLTAASLVASVGNYAFQAVMGRLLPLPEFGYLNATLGLMGLVGVPLAAASLAVTHHVARHDAAGRPEEAAAVKAATGRVIFWLTIAASALALVMITPLTHLVRVPRVTLSLVALAAVLVGMWAALANSWCAGLGQFQFLAVLSISSVAVRLLAGAAGAAAWPCAESGVGASVAAGLVVVAGVAWRDRKQLPTKYPPSPRLRRAGTADTARPGRAEASKTAGTADCADTRRHSVSPQPIRGIRVISGSESSVSSAGLGRSFLWYLAAAGAVSLGQFAFLQADLLVAQRHFSGEVLGVYSAAGLFGRAVIWVAAPVLTVYFTARSGQERSDRQTISLQALFAGLLLVGVVVVVFGKTLLCRLLLGRVDAAVVGLMPRFALAMAPVALLQAVGFHLLAARREVPCLVFGGCGIIYAGVLSYYGGDPGTLVRLITTTASAGVAVMAVVMLVDTQRNNCANNHPV